MQRLILWLNSRSKLWVVGAGLFGTVLVGLIDYLTGPWVRVSILYVLVVIFVTWLAGASCGVFVATAAAVVGFVANLYSPITTSEIVVACWNSAVDFAVLLAVSFLVLAMKKASMERRRAEYAAQTSQTLLGAYVDTALDGIIAINDQAIIDSFNPAAERIFGYSARDVIGQGLRMLMPLPAGDEHDHYIHDYLLAAQQGAIGVSREIVGRRKDGSLFPMELAVGEVQLDGRRLFSVTVRDITERRQLEKQVLEISDHERRRIAQDLHDGLCQHLAATEFATQLLTDKLAQQSLPQATEARQIGGFIQRAMTQAHEVAHGLHPVEIGPGGLMAALTDLSASVQNLYHIAFVVKANGAADLFDDFDDKEATQIYRIVQEAVANAIKHGKPSRILIELRTGGEQIVLTVNDNGLGFPEQHRQNKGMGISSMNYRACMIGAALTVRRNPNGGTAVILSFPWDFHARIRNDS
ncbi:MAG: PAS domain S-box protein [Verrucomicrobiia bacterium]|jgi:PAS domain S-box-containing protein